MTDEVELKLVVNQQFADFLAREISNFRVLKQETIFWGNCYYDTHEGYFSRRKMGLRVRRQDEHFTLTLKTGGCVTGGLHIRPEYNIELNSETPDLSGLKQFPELDITTDLALSPVFSTDFTRRMWLVECANGAEIEIALDQGEIRATGRSEPIDEVEFELKQGKLSDLLTFVGGLSLNDGIRLSSVSKAQRGYQLIAGKGRQLTDWISKWRELSALEKMVAGESAVEKTQEILTALFNMEQQLIEETIMVGIDYFAADFLRTVERISAFFNLYHYYSENSRFFETTLKTEQAESVQDILIELTESHIYLFEQIRDIIRLHSENKDNRLAMSKLMELLHQAQYVKRMLNLIRLMVKQNG